LKHEIISLITGDGQDTLWLAKLLLEKKQTVIVASRRSSSSSLWKYKEQGIADNPNLKFILMDLNEFHNVNNVVKKYKPDYIYNLGAQSFVAASWDNPLMTMQTNSLGVIYLLDSIKNNYLNTKLYQASSSEQFGKVQETPQTEKTPFYPRSMYGVSKLAAYWSVVNYRESYEVFACNGILFNHESCYRGSQFLTKKVVENVAAVRRGGQDYFELGNLNAKRDWGFAGDYCEAMFLMLQQKIPQDFVIATGETHSVKEFVEKCFNYAEIDIHWDGEEEKEIGLDSRGKILVKVNKQFYRPTEVDILLGDPSKAKEILKWKPKMSFDGLISHMMEYELKK
jgi:GDPmannose 4,6-dehydratase